jgi:hypothetical protein
MFTQKGIRDCNWQNWGCYQSERTKRVNPEINNTQYEIHLRKGAAQGIQP